LRQSSLDHLVYATRDLEATCRDLEIRLGVRASAVQLRLEHPEPELIRKQLNSLGVEVAIEPGLSPALMAIFEGANGLIELR
jgi:hypothetical protein